MKTSLFSVSVMFKHSLFSKLLYPFVCRQFPPPIKESSMPIIRIHRIQVTVRLDHNKLHVIPNKECNGAIDEIVY